MLLVNGLRVTERTGSGFEHAGVTPPPISKASKGQLHVIGYFAYA